MELWIRNQDKENLIKVDALEFCEEYNDDDKNFVYEVVTFYRDKDVILGYYKTKERALEVLDEIQKLIKPTFKINYEYDDSQPIIDGKWLKSLKAESKIEELSCYVYEMPKE